MYFALDVGSVAIVFAIEAAPFVLDQIRLGI